MWPLLLDMTPEESKRVLRRLELEAYSSIVSVFRAQGSLSKEKKKQLVDLQQTLSISTERHRAEVRRAINDEKLNTIADNTFGTDSSSEWLIEGRRLVPLMPRLVPQTAFTLTANQAANLQAERNAALPTPSLTGNKDLSSPPPSATPTMTATAVAKAPRPGSPTPNVVVLPSGVSVHIKEELDEASSRRRSRSHSAEGVASLSSPAPLSKPHPPHSAHSPSPMKITISKSPQTKPQASITSTPPQKVILLSSSGQSTAASILQKSVSMPGVRGTGGSTTTHSSPIPKTSIIYPGSSNSPASNGNLGNIVTVATTSAMQNVSASAASIYQQGFATPTGCVSKPRQKTVTRTRLTTTGTLPMMSHRPGLVVPMGPQSVHGVTSHIKTVPGKPTIQIKQEGGMKIITQTLPSSKLLPKPSSLGSGSPSVVMVTSPAQTSTTGAVTMVTRAGNPSGSKILNITTQGGKVIATTNKNPNIVTVNPKTLHLTAVKTAAGVTGGKPNVIVVQKSHGKKLTGQGTTMVTTKSAGSLPFEKELVNFIQKHDPQKIVTAKTVDNRVILTTTAQDFTALKQKSRGDGEGKTSLLAELIQAASGGALSSAAAESHAQESSPREITQHSHLPIKAVTPALPANLSNEWFEYDVTGDVPVVTDQQKSQEIPQSMIEAPQNVTDPLTGEQYYTIEQAMHLVNQDTAQKAAADPVSLLRTPTGQKNLAGVEKLGVVTSVVPGLTPDLGDLDPQTGIFHSTSPVVVETKQPGQSMDLLSTSLAQAQIDLDPYQFMEDELVTFTPIPQGQEVKEQRPQKEALVSMLTGNVVQDPTQSVKTIVDAQVLSGSSSCGPPFEASSSQLSDHSSRASSFIPIQELGSKSPRATIHVTTQGSMLRGEGNNSVTVQMQPKGVDAGALTLDELTSQRLDVSDNAPAPSSPEIDLTDTGIGTSDSADLLASQTSSDVISSQPSSEFSSQGMFSLEASDSGNVSEPGSLSEHGNVSDGGMSSDSSTTRLGKRRRKPPSAFDDSPPASSSGGWMRSALGLLNKVSKVRGSNRDRSGFDASSWFLYPVDPEDAPDYFTIIKQPMDFSTVKKKLETCQYRDFSDFNTDMLLVRENCNTYNPPGHQARQDCAEVFSVYHHEYLRLTEKLQKTRISSPNMKKLKLDKSPGKS